MRPDRQPLVRTRRAAYAGLLVCLAACGGAKSQPTPPLPGSGIGVVQYNISPYETWSGSGYPIVLRTWTGTRVNLRDKLYVTDTDGHEIHDYALMITPPAPWRAVGDSVIVPDTEQRLDLAITVARAAGAGFTPRPLAMPFVALRDLRTRQWSAAWSCGPGTLPETVPADWSAIAFDSLQFVGALTTYTDMATATPDIYQASWAGTITGWRGDTALRGPVPWTLDRWLLVQGQAPGILKVIYRPGMAQESVARAPGAPVRYVFALPPCRFGAGVGVTGQPVTLTQR